MPTICTGFRLPTRIDVLAIRVNMVMMNPSVLSSSAQVTVMTRKANCRAIATRGDVRAGACGGMRLTLADPNHQESRRHRNRAQQNEIRENPRTHRQQIAAQGYRRIDDQLVR